MKVDLAPHDAWLSKKTQEKPLLCMYAKDIREVNKEKTVSGNYIIFLDATVKSWIEGLFKAPVYQAGCSSSHL